MNEKNRKNARDPQLHRGHRERMRQRFLDTDGVGMNDHELLEVLLFYSIPRRDTNEIAHRLIDTFGSLANVINAPYISLISVDGVGVGSATLIKMLGVLMNRYSVSELQSKRLRVKSVEDAVPFLQKLLFAKSEEELYVLMFRETGMLIGYQTISLGKDPTFVHTDMGKYARIALHNQATFVIVGHNHPNGELRPSTQDIRLTQYLEQAINSFNITFAEHILVSNNGHLCIKAYMEEHSIPI